MQHPLASSEVAGQRVLPHAGWRSAAICVFLLAATFALLWPTTTSLIVAWEDKNQETYTHGYLVLALSIWLLWRDRHRLRAIPATMMLSAAVPLAAISVLWLVCFRAGIQTAHQFLLPIILWLAICTVLGWRVAMASAFAVGYLYFAVPVWDAINVALQHATVVAVDALLRATGVPAYVDGNFVHLAAGTFEIAGGCSGLHYFIVAFAISALYGEVHRDSLRARLRIVGVALILALLTNWLRVYTIILAGYFTDMQHYLVRVEHYTYGWAVFAAMMVVFFVIVRRLPASGEGHQHPAPAESAALPPRWPLAVTTALAALALGPLWSVLAPVSAAPLPQDGELLPSATPWSGASEGAGPSWQPVFRGADAERHGYYQRGGMRIEGYAVAYASQAQRKELIGFGNSLVGNDVDIIASTHIEPGGGPANELVVQDAERRQFVLWYFYRIGSMQTRSDFIAQVAYGLMSLTGSPLSTVIALRAPCGADCDTARAELRDLMGKVDL